MQDEIKNFSNKIYSQGIITRLFEFLEIKDFLELSLVNREAKTSAIEVITKKFIKDFELNSFLMKNPFAALRMKHANTLIALPIADIEIMLIHPKFQLKCFEKNILFGFEIKEFKCGPKFVGILTKRNTLFVTWTKEFENMPQYIKPQDFLLELNNVESFQVNGNCCIQLKNGSIQAINFEDAENLQLIELLSADEQYHSWQSSYDSLFVYKEREANYSIRIISNISKEDIVKELEETDNHSKIRLKFPIKNFTPAKHSIHLIDKEGQLFECSKSEDLDEDEFQKTKKIERMENCVELFTNFVSTFVAKKDSKIPTIDNWDNQQLISWFQKLGLAKYTNLLRFNKISGSLLNEMDDVDLEERLGMLDAAEVNHLILHSRLHEKERFKEPELIGWGYNKNLELGIYTGTVSVVVPQSLGISLEDDEDDVKYVDLKGKHSHILSNKGKLFLSYHLR